MSWRFDEFRNDDDDNDDANVAPRPPADVPPVIGVRAGASVALSGAALLGLQFRQTRCTFKDLRKGEVIARKQDRGRKDQRSTLPSASLPQRLCPISYLALVFWVQRIVKESS
jgi:hypothetical protein